MNDETGAPEELREMILGTVIIPSHKTSHNASYLAAGVRKIVVNHPEHWMIDMKAEDQRELASRGVMLEKCLQTILTKGVEQSPKILADMIKAVGAQSVVMATDGGLKGDPTPPQGLKWFIEQMLEYGISAEDIETMVRVHPSRLLGI